MAPHLPLLSLSHPFSLRDPAIVVDIRDVCERFPDLLEERLGDLVLVAVDLPAAHPAYLVLGPQEVVVRQAPVVVQVCNIEGVKGWDLSTRLKLNMGVVIKSHCEIFRNA